MGSSVINQFSVRSINTRVYELATNDKNGNEVTHKKCHASYAESQSALLKENMIFTLYYT